MSEWKLKWLESWPPTGRWSLVTNWITWNRIFQRCQKKTMLSSTFLKTRKSQGASWLGPETLRTFIQGLTRKEFFSGKKPTFKIWDIISDMIHQKKGMKLSLIRPSLSFLSAEFIYTACHFHYPASSKWSFDHPNGGHQQTLKRSRIKPPKGSLGRTWISILENLGKYHLFRQRLGWFWWFLVDGNYITATCFPGIYIIPWKSNHLF